VNDAPALKKANIGIAMGKRGKQVAKEAADIILQDDAFSTIVTAVEHGRIIFNNIRKFVVYLLSGNMGEILIVALASFAGAPLPLLPLQILYINVVNDAFPALALGLGQEGKDVMGRPPRDSDEPVITKKHWYAITGYGFLIASAVLAGFWIALEHFHFSREKAVTVVFLSLTLGRLWHVFNMRNRGSGLFKNQIVKNPYVWIAFSICTGLVLLALYIPALAGVLKLVHPGIKGWLLAIGISLVPYVVGQFWISLRGERSEP
jgi:Ca2+-transporting ATPase